MFTPIEKEIIDSEGSWGRAFYLAETEAFVAPITVVPDIGASNKAKYFLLTPRAKWAGEFEKWVEAPYYYRDMDEEDAARR